MSTNLQPGVAGRARAGKIRFGSLIASVARRSITPTHLAQAAKLHWNRRQNRKRVDDAQLELYSKLLPSDFLHFGFFDDVDRQAEDISLNELARAQCRYADLLLERVIDREHLVLDIGAGMGGLSRMLLEHGFSPVALTPDRVQVAHLTKTYPNLPVLQTKLENLVIDATQAQAYGTVITSESFQYLKLDKALEVLEAVLRPGGRWVICDFFNRGVVGEKGCHDWDVFTARVHAAGWRIVEERDITANVLPTLRYANMWATRAGIPFMNFFFAKLKRKQPGLHHLLSDAMGNLSEIAHSNLALIDPVRFAAEKRYMMLVLDRAPATA